MGRVPSRGSDQFVVRFPDGMREIIREAADANGRSMNAEILARLEESFQHVIRIPDDLRTRIEASANENRRSINAEAIQVLEQYFPPEPNVYELLDNIEMFLRWSRNPNAPPYKRHLIEAIKELGWRLERGIEFDPVKPQVLSPEEAEQRAAWKRNANTRRDWIVRTENSESVSTEDFKNAIEKGFLDHTHLDRVEPALEALEEGNFGRSLSILGLTKIKFSEPERVRKLLSEKLHELADDTEF